MDSRRPTSNGPKAINNGVIVMKREQAGYYTHTKRFIVYVVMSTTFDGGGTLWSWHKEEGPTSEYYATKKEACRALQLHLYGEYTTEAEFISYHY